MSEPLIRFENVSIVFGGAPESALPLMDAGKDRTEIQRSSGQILGVHDCSLDVAEGEIAVLMGLSGSGKSTLLRAVNGLNPVVRGAMWVHDGQQMVDVAKSGKRALRQLRSERISMVFQQFGLLPWRTVIDNVALGLELAGRPRAEQLDRARAQLDTVNLSDWADKKVGELSGGMQQRVGLARAFATDAPILLMDEPFSALDPLIRSRLQDELLELQQRLHRTIVFVSHDLEEAVKLGSKIAILEGGRIVQAGTAQEIVLSPATEYVADFVSHLNPLTVLCAEHVGQTGTVDQSLPQVAPGTPLTDLLPQLGQGQAVRCTADGTERRITAADVIQALSAGHVAGAG